MRSSALTSLAHPHEGQRASRLGGPSASAPKALVSLVSPREALWAWAGGGRVGVDPRLVSGPSRFTQLFSNAPADPQLPVYRGLDNTISQRQHTHALATGPRDQPRSPPPSSPSSLESATCGVFKSSLVPRRPCPGHRAPWHRGPGRSSCFPSLPRQALFLPGDL